MLRYLTAGESHGPCLTAIIDGLPAGLNLTVGEINTQLTRRQGGYGRGGRMKIEQDQVKITSGVRGGVTTGSPVTLVIENKDWENWFTTMAPGPEADLKAKVVTRPRPGHADLVGGIKYRHSDMRNVLERSSARETAARVAVGGVARSLLRQLDINVVGAVMQIGDVQAPPVNTALKPSELAATVDKSPVYCPNPQASEQMIAEIQKAQETKDTLGGIFEVYVFGLPPGLGSYVQRDQTLDGRLAGALMSIQAIKGVEVGSGFAAAKLRGSKVHDEIFYDARRGFYRKTNHAGGIEGGMSNGELLVLRAAMKPIPTLYQPLHSVDMLTKESQLAAVERSDACAVPAACVVGEAVVAWELAVVLLNKFGGDTWEEIYQRLQQYYQYIQSL